MEENVLKILLIVSGTFFLFLGLIGIFIPILPTTPFLLLAAACYARGSKKFYNWLINNRFLGKYIKNYREGRGISLKIKIITISILWITILFTTFLIVTNLLLQIILLIIAICVTIHLLTIKTMKK